MEDFSDEELSWSGSGVVEDNYTLRSTCAVSTLEAAANSTILPAPVAITARVFQILYGSLQVVLGILLNVLLSLGLRS